MRRRARAAALALAVLAGCGGPPVDRTWQDAATHRWRALEAARGDGPGFSAVDAAVSGLVHRNTVADSAALADRHLLLGSGVAIGDVDGDDRPDLVFGTTAGAVHLYRNAGGLRFTDVTGAAGLAAPGAPVTGLALADVEADGDLDLLVGTLGGPLQLWRNDGRGRFTDATATAGLPGGRAVTTLTLADVDGDGDLDLFAATYKRRNALDVYPPQDRAFDQVVKRVAGRYVVDDRWRDEYRVEDRPDLGGVVRSQRAEPDLFLVNDGTGRFTAEPVAGERWQDADGRPLPAPPDHFTLAARFYDVTGDGAPDLYVCNDFEDPDQFWRNDGQGRFRLFPVGALAATSNTCMSVEFGDVDRDGHVDLFTADMLAPTRAMRQRQVPTHTPLPKGLGAPRDRPQWMRNMLHVARGDGTWAELADQAGVTATDWTWGSLFLDVDLDGFEDLLAATGHRWDIREADVYDAIRDRFPRVPWNREQGEFPPDTAHAVALRNTGDGRFTDARATWRFGAKAGIHHAIAAADLDGDGDQDVVLTRLNDVPLLYRNDARAPRLLVTVEGDAAAPAIGAVVTVDAPGRPRQSREVTAGGLYLASGAPQLTFAMGEGPARVTVRWRDGRTRLVEAVPAGREVRLSPRGAGVASGAPGARPAPLFTDATATLDGAAHRDSLFDDFARQPLLPGRLSQLGPGLAVVDADGDGADEVWLAGGRSGALTRVTWRDGRGRAEAVRAAPLDQTAIVPVPDGTGGTRLLVGQASYEAATPELALLVPSVLSVDVARDTAGRGGAVRERGMELAGDAASTGPLALADVDGDGRLDLFVGARVRPGAWPLPAPSRLYRRTVDGRWALDSANAAALGGLGLVSGATFADLDDDGDPDLVAVGEFGPIRILRNDGGRLVDATAAWGLAERRSRWNGVAAGDFDGDGRLDLVVTSWGENLPWAATPARPHTLWVGDFGAAPPGLVAAQADADGGEDYPLEPLPRLAFAVGDVRERFATFGAFATATVPDVLGARAARSTRIGATGYRHLVLLNRGTRFDVRPLPPAAQVAPAFGIVVADFDADGAEDLFLAQNFSPTSIELPRFAAGRGQLLLGDGRGAFRALGVPESGLAIAGDQRGAAAGDVDGDGRTDLWVAQSAGALTLWRNAAPRRGVRVRLEGGAGNPFAFGAVVALDGEQRTGAARLIAGGGGYWSLSSPTVVLAAPSGEAPTRLRVRWPDGRRTVHPVRAGAGELTIRAP